LHVANNSNTIYLILYSINQRLTSGTVHPNICRESNTTAAKTGNEIIVGLSWQRYPRSSNKNFKSVDGVSGVTRLQAKPECTATRLPQVLYIGRAYGARNTLPSNVPRTISIKSKIQPISSTTGALIVNKNNACANNRVSTRAHSGSVYLEAHTTRL